MISFFITDSIFFTPNLKKSRGYATYLSSIIGWFRISYRVNESWFEVVSCPIRVLYEIKKSYLGNKVTKSGLGHPIREVSPIKVHSCS